MSNELSEAEVNEIKRLAAGKLGECRKGNDVIGTQIFSILSLFARVIYYPLGKDAPWGFTRIKGSENDINQEKPFVAINTSIPEDCQVFAAAHELYHIWFEQTPDVLPADLLNEQDKEINERKANRFAAEFLVDQVLLNQEMNLYGIKEITIKGILQLCELFVVPYRTMVKRLREIERISDEKMMELLMETEESIGQYRKKYSFVLRDPDERIVMNNLIELAVNAYEKEYITFEKLEYLLDLSKLTPEDLGIVKMQEYGFPSDDELDSIMEE
ncbi:MAG: ImmA/IrrE family metallo-endopeptidase [Lachnospiraceae bacterium]|nr:ImmA/IrrE family metallo-endopeptidase [Lachnospiraceae bacterium]